MRKIENKGVHGAMSLDILRFINSNESQKVNTKKKWLTLPVINVKN